MGPVTKNRPTSLVPQGFFMLYVFLERNLRRGSAASLSSPLVSVVSPNRGRARDGLCSTCSSRLKTSSNPVNNKPACTMWTKRRTMRMRRKFCCTTKHEGRKILCAGGKSNTNSSQSAQEFAPAPQDTQNDTDSPAGDLSH